jgi:hypothetical protein
MTGFRKLTLLLERNRIYARPETMRTTARAAGRNDPQATPFADGGAGEGIIGGSLVIASIERRR